MRWQPRRMLSTETIAEFLRVWRVERVIEYRPVFVSGLPKGVNHSIYARGCRNVPKCGGRSKITRTCATRRPSKRLLIK